MATKQSKFYAGNAQIPFNTPHKAGSVITVVGTLDLSAGLLAADVLELIPFHPYAKIVDFDISDVGSLIGTTNITIGMMSGTPGDTAAVRTVGSELINAQAAGTAVASTLAEIAAIPRNDGSAKSIGLKVSANVTAGAGKALHFRYSYTA